MIRNLFFKKSPSQSYIRIQRQGESNSEVFSLDSLISTSAVFELTVYMLCTCGFSVLQELLSLRQPPKEIQLLVVAGPNTCNGVVGF